MSEHNCGCGECGGHHEDHCGHHDEHCGCGCERLVISLDGETDTTCNIIGAFGVAEMDYIALQPVDENAVLIFRYTEQDDGITLDNIDDDDEYQKVVEAFYGLFEDNDDDFVEDGLIIDGFDFSNDDDVEDGDDFDDTIYDDNFDNN